MRHFLFILILVVTLVYASVPGSDQFPDQRGSTHSLMERSEPVEVGIAPEYFPTQRPESRDKPEKTHLIKPVSTTNHLDFYLPAGEYFTIRFNHENESLNLIYPELANPFSTDVQAAVEKAPDWLENDLFLIFSQLSAPYREKWAQVILDADDPFIDEIAFTIAHLSPQYLMSAFAYTELLALNAKLIYDYDQHLKYVDVIDYGSSETDPDYYSTTKYRKAVYTDTFEVELPRDIYYWYIVHPKISDEIPAFINPDIVEYTHRENITDPDHGYFWREFLYTHADPGYARFQDMIAGCTVVWNNFPAPPNSASTALETMNRWLNASILFTSENDRPHQPVRIYRKHMGRCGEFGDMRVALARTALIPTTSVATYSQDHVWNEFWDERWIHWDGVADDPMMYVDDWHKEFNTVFSWRSDGSFTSVTDRYTREYATLNIYAVDSLSTPIDGARIILYAPGLYEDKAFDNYGVTDTEGKVTFIVAADRTYWARMECDYGNLPSGDGQVLRVISSSRDGEVYNVLLAIDQQKPTTNWDDIPVPQTGDYQFFLELDVTIPDQILRGRDLFDDLDLNAYQFITQPRGLVNFFITDENNYTKYQTHQPFQGFHSSYDSLDRMIGFEFNDASDWYCVFDNSNALHTLQHITGSVNLYTTYDENIADVQIRSNFPNPLVTQSGMVTIVYQLPRKTKVEMVLYDILGKKIKTLIREEKYAGEFEVQWDGKNDLDVPVASGLYFCRIKTDQGIDSRRIAVMR